MTHERPTGGSDVLPARRRRPDGWALLLLPALFALTIVFLLPMALLASNSLHGFAGPGIISPAFTLANYAKFLGDPFYLGILLRTFELGAIVVTVCMVAAYPVAYAMARSQSRWKGTLIFLIVSPLLISVVIRNLGWLPILGNSGLLNTVLLRAGILSNPVQLTGNFTGVVIGLVHAMLPFMILSIMTVIQRIPRELEEAAINLGAGPVQTFWRVLLPLSRPGLLAGYLLVFTVVISAFVTPAMMGGKRVLVMATFIDQQIRTVLNYPFGATTAVILMLVSGMVTIVALRVPAES